MVMKQSFGALSVFAALLTSQAAQAADSVYLGDCERAEQVKAQSTIDTLLPHKKFEGVLRLVSWKVTNNCTVDQLQTYTLTQRSRTNTEIIYDVISQAISTPQIPNGVAPEMRPTAIGTVRFNTVLDRLGDLCEVYMWSAWTLTTPTDPSWKDSFSNRALSLTGGHFIISQLHPDGTQRNTPMAFTGVSK